MHLCVLAVKEKEKKITGTHTPSLCFDKPAEISAGCFNSNILSVSVGENKIPESSKQQKQQQNNNPQRNKGKDLDRLFTYLKK